MKYYFGMTGKEEDMQYIIPDLRKMYDEDEQVKKIVDKQYEEAKQLLNDNRDMLEYISKNLLEKETLDEKEFEDLMNEVRNKRNSGSEQEG